VRSELAREVCLGSFIWEGIHGAYGTFGEFCKHSESSATIRRVLQPFGEFCGHSEGLTAPLSLFTKQSERLPGVPGRQ